MKLKSIFFEQGKADGIYQLQAPGCAAALLSWADERGALEEWTSFAYIPLDAFGRGSFRFQGGRAIPAEAGYIHVKAVADDLMHWEEMLFPIPDIPEAVSAGQKIRFYAMSDLHLSLKPGLLKAVLSHIKEMFSQMDAASALLLAGDMTNDGIKQQYELLKECLLPVLSRMPVLPVIGNHDMPQIPLESRNRHEIYNYALFQEWIFEKMKESVSDDKRKTLMEECTMGPDGAYAVSMGSVEIIGLQAVADQRRFVFEEGRQLEWLDRHLSLHQDMCWHLVLCHAPLIYHNPKREYDKNNPYLNRDKQLQKILDSHKRVIFLSGHTHLSMDNPKGCVEWDEKHENVYINDASIRPTDLLPGEAMQPAEWKNGTFLDITICENEVEIVTRSAKDGKKHARGYYRISAPDLKCSHNTGGEF